VLFYSTYGHIYRLAQAIADGAREVPGVDVVLKRVPETLSAEAINSMGATEAQKAFASVPIATVGDLVDAGAIIFGTPTRFGNMAGQMRQFLDGTGVSGRKQARGQSWQRCLSAPPPNMVAKSPPS